MLSMFSFHYNNITSKHVKQPLNLLKFIGVIYQFRIFNMIFFPNQQIKNVFKKVKLKFYVKWLVLKVKVKD